MSWTKLNANNPSSRTRAMPKDIAGRKPIPPGRYIKKGLLSAALKVWELKQGFKPERFNARERGA